MNVTTKTYLPPESGADLVQRLCNLKKKKKATHSHSQEARQAQHVVALARDDVIFHVTRAGSAGGCTSAEALGPAWRRAD